MSIKFGDKRTNLILGVVVLALLIVCAASIIAPLRFVETQAEREEAVKLRLTKIRAAESRFQSAYGYYCGSIDSLVSTGFLADSLKYIPYSDNKKFKITATMFKTKSGKELPVMECSAEYEDYLFGLDEDRIADAIQDAKERGVYPGLKIGNLTNPSDNTGNWE